MTLPVPHGTPDWDTPVSVSATVYVNDTGTVQDSFTDPVGYVGNTQFLAVNFQALVKGWALNFLFYADAAFATFLDSYAFEFLQGDFLDEAVPVYGPYLKITGQSSAAGGSESLSVWNVAGPVGGILSSSRASSLIASEGNNIAGGGTQDFDSTTVTTKGPLTLSVNTNSTDWTAKLYAVNSTGTQRMLGFVGNNLEPHDFNPTNQHLRVHVSNFQAGAAVFDVALTSRPTVG